MNNPIEKSQNLDHNPREDAIKNLKEAWAKILKMEHDTGLDYTHEKDPLLHRARELGIDITHN
ncbi:MAG: hypothetical protein ABIS26_00980 [Candidatus Paceibacterota bacterium]